MEERNVVVLIQAAKLCYENLGHVIIHVPSFSVIFELFCTCETFVYQVIFSKQFHTVVTQSVAIKFCNNFSFNCALR